MLEGTRSTYLKNTSVRDRVRDDEIVRRANGKIFGRGNATGNIKKLERLR